MIISGYARRGSFRLSFGALSFMGLLPLMSANARDVTFNPAFLNTTTGEAVDVSRFNGSYRVPAGDYQPDIYLNGRLVNREHVTVRELSSGSQVCIRDEMITLLNINRSRLADSVQKSLMNKNACLTMEDIIPGASARMNLSDMRLEVAVPQAYISQNARGYVPSSLWSYGEKALYLSYNTTYFEQHNRNDSYKSFYGDLKGGVNLGAWMLRHSGTYRWNERSGDQYTGFATNLQRDIPDWNSRLLLGDATTSGTIFDSFSFRGVQLATAEQMLPDSLRGYAPVVRGLARSNARVTIRQRDRVIYEASVPPGEFAINDLYPTGYGGDLQVSVTESDGSESRFVVPYASVAELLRPGRVNYSLLAGRLRNISVADAPDVFQGTWKRGINNTLTVYSGVTALNYYWSALAGTALGTPVGAFSVDVNGTFFNKDGVALNGSSVRASYSKFISATNSNFSLAAYRFSSSNYLDLHNAVYVADRLKNKDSENSLATINRPRNRVSVTLSQELGEGLGQLYISGYKENYWNKASNSTQYQMGYSNQYKRLSYSLAVNRTETRSGNNETQYVLNFSIPLGNSTNSPYLTSFTTATHDGVSSQAGINGQLGAKQQMNYNLSAGKDEDNNYTGSANGSWRFNNLSMTMGGTKGERYHSWTGGMSGSVVAFGDGIVASPYDNLNTMAIVSARNAPGARIEGYSGVETNRWGYALVPYMTPYRINEVVVDPKGLPYDIELQSTSKQIAPAQGAIVKIDYATTKGRMVLIRARMPDGQSLPFGAAVTDAKGKNIGVVAQGGQIYARLEEGTTSLKVSWGNGSTSMCAFNVTLSPTDKQQTSFERVNSVCQTQ